MVHHLQLQIHVLIFEYAEKFLQIICENYYSLFSLKCVYLFWYLHVDDSPVGFFHFL